MSEYFYLCSSLPCMRFDAKPLIGTSEFLELCQRVTQPQDYSVISQAKLHSSIPLKDPEGILRQWQEREMGLRNELVKLRARKLGKDAESHLNREWLNPGFAAVAATLASEESPLKAELALLSEQWKILNELEAGHAFDVEFLVIYCLRLQILERKALFETEKGKEKLQSILTGVKTNE